jgi:hypothetical protein
MATEVDSRTMHQRLLAAVPHRGVLRIAIHSMGDDDYQIVVNHIPPIKKPTIIELRNGETIDDAIEQLTANG